MVSSSYSLGYINQSEYIFINPLAIAFDNEDYYHVDSVLTYLNLCSYNYDSIPHIFGAKSVYLNSKFYWSSFFNIYENKILEIKNNYHKYQGVQLPENFVWAADALGLAIGARVGREVIPASAFGVVFSGIAIIIKVIYDESRRCPVCGIIHDC